MRHGDQFFRSLNINCFVGSKHAKNEPIGDAFELFNADSHLLQLCVCIDKVTSPWTDHDEYWNGDLVSYAVESFEIWSGSSSLRSVAELYPISSSLVRNQC